MTRLTPLTLRSLAPYAHAYFRVAGALLALFVLANAVGDLIAGRFGVDFMWIRFPSWCGLLGRIWIVAMAIALLCAAFGPIRNRKLALAAEGLLVVGAAVALWNGLGFYWLLLSGRISSSFPFPSSVLVCTVVAVNAARVWTEHVANVRADAAILPRRRVVLYAASFGVTAVVGPLLLLLCYGATDYSGSAADRPADFIVVYGAKAYADGTPSLCLHDRVREGVRQWKAGAGRMLVMSGGVGRNGVSEPEVMKRIAVRAGVPADAIVADETGVNTFRTVATTARLAAERDWRRSVSVSHYYHLFRIHMAARRAGVVTYTVPARMTRRLAQEPWYVFREVLAFYGYYFLRW